MLDLAGWNALLFVLDLDDQVLLSPRSAALVATAIVATAIVASAVVAVAAAAAAKKTATEQGTAFGQAELLAGVGIAPLLDFFGLGVRNTDAVVGTTMILAASAIAARLNDHGVIRSHAVGHS
jgi:hypothetical protein